MAEKFAAGECRDEQGRICSVVDVWLVNEQTKKKKRNRPQIRLDLNEWHSGQKVINSVGFCIGI